jgi:hypothetical protein
MGCPCASRGMAPPGFTLRTLTPDPNGWGGRGIPVVRIRPEGVPGAIAVACCGTVRANMKVKND